MTEDGRWICPRHGGYLSAEPICPVCRGAAVDDDDYPPYAEEEARRDGRRAADLLLQLRQERQQQARQDRLCAVACGIVAALAIGGLLIAYGVF